MRTNFETMMKTLDVLKELEAPMFDEDGRLLEMEEQVYALVGKHIEETTDALTRLNKTQDKLIDALKEKLDIVELLNDKNIAAEGQNADGSPLSLLDRIKWLLSVHHTVQYELNRFRQGNSDLVKQLEIDNKTLTDQLEVSRADVKRLDERLRQYEKQGERSPTTEVEVNKRPILDSKYAMTDRSRQRDPLGQGSHSPGGDLFEEDFETD